MANKTKKQLDCIELEGELLNSVNYATYFCRFPLFTTLKILNRAEENISEVTLVITGSTPLIMPFEKTLDEIPHQSSIEISAENLLNPKYLADLEEPAVCKVKICLSQGKDVYCTYTTEVLALPIDSWCGLSGNAEMLASFEIGRAHV